MHIKYTLSFLLILRLSSNQKIIGLKNKRISETYDGDNVVLHANVLKAIQEVTKNVKPVHLSIHPVPYRNMLILPQNIDNVADKPWDVVRQLGRCKNKIKTDPNTKSVALESSWEQFATLGVEMYENPLQESLTKNHDVQLHANVQLDFDPNAHSIVPNVPWWNNREKVCIDHTVGFVWQYKIPTHSRMTLKQTTWKNALDINGIPMKMFNLPKHTSNYAVRLAFMKPNETVSISNTIYGTEVYNHMRHVIETKRRISNPLQLNENDVKRLTKKARAIMNIEDMSRKPYLLSELKKQGASLSNYKSQHNALENALALNRTKIKSFLQDNTISASRRRRLISRATNGKKILMEQERFTWSLMLKNINKITNLKAELNSLRSGSVHAPGLVSKDINARKIYGFVRDRLWSNPWVDDLPDECCLMLEPSLAKYEYDVQLEKLLSDNLRPSNYDPNVSVPDVDGDVIRNSIWELEQNRSFALFTSAARKLLPIEKQIQQWSSMVRNVSRTSIGQQAQIDVLNEYESQMTSLTTNYENDLSTLETNLQSAQNDIDNQDAIIEQEIQESQEQLQSLMDAISDAENEERDLQYMVSGIETTITNLQEEQTPDQNEIEEKKKDLKERKKELAEKEKEKKEKEKELNNEKEKIKEQKLKELQKEFQEAEEKIKKREEEYNKNLDLLQEMEEESIKQKMKASQRLEEILTRDAKLFNSNFQNGLVNIKEQNVQLSLEDKIYPADLKYGGGYFASYRKDIVKKPYGFYTYQNKNKLSSGLMENKTSEFYDENGELVTLNEDEVYPLLNDDIFLQGDNPTTSIKKLGLGKDELKYFGINEQNEQLTFELPYAIGTKVGFTYKVPDPDYTPSNPYESVLQYKTSLKGVTNLFNTESYSTGRIEQVHVINSKSVEKMSKLKELEKIKADSSTQMDKKLEIEKEIKLLKEQNGMFVSGEGYQSMLVANVRINENLVLDGSLNAGAPTLSGAVTMNSTLGVTGASTLSTLTVSGASSFVVSRAPPACLARAARAAAPPPPPPRCRCTCC